MDTFAERLSLAMAGPPKIKQVELAAACGIKPPSVSDWLSGRSVNIEGKNLLAASKLLNVRPEWLSKGTGTMRPARPSQSETEISSVIPGGVPLISMVSAGGWCEAIDNFQPGDAELWLPKMPGNGERTYALRVDGDSMTSPYPGQRSYPAGTIIYVDPDKEVLSGKGVIAKLAGTQDVTFKIYVVDAGKAYLKPLNPQYQMIPIETDIQFCGVIQGSYFPE